MIIIYSILSPSNKIYIGQTHDLKKRLRFYKGKYCKHQPKLYASLNKYGWDNHKLEILLELREDISQASINCWEQYFMDLYKANYELMNLKDADSGGLYSEESKLKMKNSRIKFKQQLSERWSGKNNPSVTNNHWKQTKHHSETSKLKMSESHKNYKLKPETKLKLALISKERFKDINNNPSYKGLITVYKDDVLLGDFAGVPEVRKVTKLGKTTITNLLMKRRSRVKGYTMYRKNNFKYV